MIKELRVDPEPGSQFFRGFRTLWPTKEDRVENLKSLLNSNASSELEAIENRKIMNRIRSILAE